MNRQELAVSLKHNRHNCCQAVLCAFEDKTDLNADALRKIGAGFGGGMGCMESTCGSLCAAVMLMGLSKYEGRPVTPVAASMNKRFEQMCGATICKDLKGRDTGVVLCECDDCVRNAVAVAEEFLS